MKKTLLALVSLFMTIGVSADEVTFDFTGDTAYGMTLLSGNTSEYNTDPTVCTEGSVTITLNGSTRWWKVTGGNQLRFYKGSSMDVAAPEGNVVTSVVLTTKSSKSFETSVGTYDNGTWTGAAQTASISCNLSSGNAGVSTITVTYQKSDAVKKNPGLSFSETSVSAVLGEAFTAPTLTKATTADVVYSSSNEEVATVDAATGAVTLVARGTVEITATAAENDEYAAGNAKYTLEVTSTKQDDVTLPYSETFESGLGDFVTHDESLGEGLTYVWKYDSNYKCAKASAYVNKKNIPSASYLVSPWIVIPSDASYCTLTFDQAVNKYFGTLSEEAQLWIYKTDMTTDLLTLTYPEIAQDKSFSEFETQTVDLTAYKGQKIIVAFKYESTDSNSGTWEIKNFNVTSDGSATGISDVAAEKTNVNAPVYNLAGQRVNANAKGILIKNGKKFVK